MCNLTIEKKSFSMIKIHTYWNLIRFVTCRIPYYMASLFLESFLIYRLRGPLQKLLNLLVSQIKANLEVGGFAIAVFIDVKEVIPQIYCYRNYSWKGNRQNSYLAKADWQKFGAALRSKFGEKTENNM